MSLKQIALADCARVPWRNGGGFTRELLRWPASIDAIDTNDDHWLLRVSVAEIARDGPFSAFPGVERWFAVLQGAGVRLALPQREHELRPDDDPVHFAGEAAPGCALIGGPTEDLNLMHRRGPAPGPRALMRRAAAGSVQRGRLPWRALYAHAATRLQADDETLALPAGTLVWCDTQAGEAWECIDTEAAFWMSLQP